jgi:16S rRNA G1207 methylase RsmC
MAKVLGVTRSGYYAWRKSSKEPSARLLKQHSRDEQIKAIFVHSKERSGARRIQVDLAAVGEFTDLKTIMNSMTRQNLVAKLHVNSRQPLTVTTSFR